MLAQLKSYLHNRKLQRFSGTNLHKTSENHFAKISTVGFLFDANSEGTYRAVKSFTKTLKKKRGIKSTTLGYFDSKNTPDVSSFRYFTVEHLTFDLLPKSEIAIEFIEKEFDLLINCCPESFAPVNYICAASNALFKIGPSTAIVNHYDILIDVPGGFNISLYLDQIDATLNLTQ